MIKGRFYRNSLVLILIITSIPGIIVGGIVYWIAVSQFENELLQLHKNQIVQRASNVDEQFSYLETSLAHWAFDPKFYSELTNVNFNWDFEVAREINRTLGLLQGSTPLAGKAELFLDAPLPILFHPQYEVLMDQSSIDGYKQILAKGKMIFWEYMETDPGHPETKELTLTHKLPGAEPNPFGLLSIQLDRHKVTEVLKTLTPYNFGETFMMSSSGAMLISSEGDQIANTFEDALSHEVLNHSTDSGSFLYEWKGDTYTVSYGSFLRLDTNWTYVSASPISLITKPLDFISKLILSVSFASLILAAVLSWLASRRIYSPIGRLTKVMIGNSQHSDGLAEHHDEFKFIETHLLHLTRESKTLQTKLEKQLPHVREGFLLQLMQGFLYSYTEEDLLERMRNFGWEVDDRQFQVMHINLTGFSNLEGRFSQGDEGLVTFAAANIIEELALNRFKQADAVNFHDLSIGLLIMMPVEQVYREEMHLLSEEITAAINHLLKLQISIGIGRASDSLVHIPSNYEETKQVLSYRSFVNENQVIDLASLETAAEAREMHYPFMLEREIIQMIRTGQQKETELLIASFLETLRFRGREIDVQQGLLQLLGSILHAIRQLGMDPNRVFKSANLYEQLTQIREPQKMLDWFNGKLVQPVILELEDRSDAQIKKAIETAMIYLQNQYMNEISLDSCADHIGIGAGALSKLFKQVSGKNFIDYLTEIRMDKAKELLRDTELKINDIAVRVGYQHSYFNRIFKKQESITPGQYREINRKNE